MKQFKERTKSVSEVSAHGSREGKAVSIWLGQPECNIAASLLYNGLEPSLHYKLPGNIHGLLLLLAISFLKVLIPHPLHESTGIILMQNITTAQ